MVGLAICVVSGHLVDTSAAGVGDKVDGNDVWRSRAGVGGWQPVMGHGMQLEAMMTEVRNGRNAVNTPK